MPRVIKHPDVRRSEILDWTRRVFLSRGYDSASLNEVIDETSVSKSAFYHCCSPKEQASSSKSAGCQPLSKRRTNVHGRVAAPKHSGVIFMIAPPPGRGLVCLTVWGFALGLAAPTSTSMLATRSEPSNTGFGGHAIRIGFPFRRSSAQFA
ncbi:TetR/AcrR family transcriptional regulator [Bradyrhizobium elkanii]|nr:TetR/AcrR family transcriptional regulator [Bradyrhizobium elkanii]